MSQNTNCTPLNPCNCIGKPSPNSNGTAPPKPSCSKGKNCIKYQDTIIEHIAAVGPCGKAGTFDVSTINCDLTGCAEGATTRFYLQDFDREHFVSATMEGSVITWITQGDHRLGRFGTINLKACCVTESGHTISHLFCVTIGMKDLCLCPDCELCNKCDPCTGNCIDNDVNLVAS